MAASHLRNLGYETNVPSIAFSQTTLIDISTVPPTYLSHSPEVIAASISNSVEIVSSMIDKGLPNFIGQVLSVNLPPHISKGNKFCRLARVPFIVSTPVGFFASFYQVSGSSFRVSVKPIPAEEFHPSSGLPTDVGAVADNYTSIVVLDPFLQAHPVQFLRIYDLFN